MAKTISATTAARRLSDVLDEVEHRGTEFIIERHGRAIASLTPRTVPSARLTWGDLRERVKLWPKPDDGFAADLARIRGEQGRLPTNPWGRSSTRRS